MNVGIIFYLSLFFTVAIISIFSYQEGRRSVIKKEIKKEISKCFEDVNWEKKRFNCNGVIFKDSSGNEWFYGSKQIDDAINRLNKVLDDWSTK